MVGTESHKESSTYLLKWKPIVCAAKYSSRRKDSRSGHHQLARQMMLKPEKLMAFRSVTGSIEGEFYQQALLRHRSHLPVTGYQFSWTEISSISQKAAVPDCRASQRLLLPPVREQPFIIINELKPSTTYQTDV
ncbi:anosmin-1-like [Gopherus evgoodei]|uniref:anosmin-1-like n=1 Tax=Gopherus evgoodei TaxID=1825980 RepID=UPI0011CFCA65|nr:anosmin-1-like [Gopherus evgoodei]